MEGHRERIPRDCGSIKKIAMTKDEIISLNL